MLVPFAGNGKRANFISEQWSASEKTPFNRIPSGEKNKKQTEVFLTLWVGLKCDRGGGRGNPYETDRDALRLA